MRNHTRVSVLVLVALLTVGTGFAVAQLGEEKAIEQHLQNGQEFLSSTGQLLGFGKKLFEAVWTDQEGGGRPLAKGTGAPLADPGDPLVFPRNFNRVSAPDANSCAGCHNQPFSGGGGDQVANVFVLGQRFDFATFDLGEVLETKGSVDERGIPVTLQEIANERNTLGMFGAGLIEMLARQMTTDLQAIRDSIAPGGSAALVTKGISFGQLSRFGNGDWFTDDVEGLPDSSLATTGSADPPNLIIRPFHQAGAVVSLREFTNNAFNHHHGMQSEERFGAGVDADGDGFVNELTRADITAATLFQAALWVPGRVIPNDPEIEQAVFDGENNFDQIGCTECHVVALPLDAEGWVFSEPNPFNPPGNLQVGEVPSLELDLTDPSLPGPQLQPNAQGVVWVPALTDMKLHDITSGPGDPNREELNMHFPAGSNEFFAGNSRFLTKKLWGAANEPPFFHHGKYTTMRQAIEAHHGEAEASHQAWDALTDYQQDSIIEFLKTLQVLPPSATSRIVDENGNPRSWPRQFP